MCLSRVRLVCVIARWAVNGGFAVLFKNGLAFGVMARGAKFIGCVHVRAFELDGMRSFETKSDLSFIQSVNEVSVDVCDPSSDELLCLGAFGTYDDPGEVVRVVVWKWCDGEISWLCDAGAIPISAEVCDGGGVVRVCWIVDGWCWCWFFCNRLVYGGIH